MSKRNKKLRARQSRRMNEHHMAWPRRSYSGIQKEARQLPCMKVMLDIEVHRVLHDMYNFPRLMKEEDARLLVDRHRARVCACYDRDGQILTNMFTINGEEEDDGASDLRLREV